MSEASNKNLVRRRIEQFAGEGNVATADELFAPDYINHDPPFPDHNRNQLKQGIVRTRRGVSDARITIEHMIAEGSWVATHYTLRGIHSGELRGIPPTGKPVVLPGIVLSRILDGKIVEEWNFSDKLGLFWEQLGALPARRTKLRRTTAASTESQGNGG